VGGGPDENRVHRKWDEMSGVVTECGLGALGVLEVRVDDGCVVWYGGGEGGSTGSSRTDLTQQ
jgi:hypothetical protein